MPGTQLLNTVQTYLPLQRVQLVRDALEFASSAHEGQSRMSGEPFIEHPVATAEQLADMKMDATTISAALLHDVIEDCGVELQTLESAFGPEVSRLVDSVTKLSRIDTLAGINVLGKEETRAASTRKMLVAMAEDVRVVMIKLADRLHNMRTLSHLPARRRLRIAKETLDIYAPLAHRLGMSDIKWKLEDEAFRYIQPNQYKSISRLIRRKRVEREAYAQQASRTVTNELKKNGVNAIVLGRPKHLYSTYNKLKRYEEQGRNFDEIYDLIALRIVTDTVANCYAALGIIHSIWRPVLGQFDDYIATPKENLYQSLHTSVIGPEGNALEVQIRTKQMHRIAEDGVAAHWAYKESDEKPNGQDDRFEQKLSWLKQLIEWQRELQGDQEYLDSVKTDVLRDQVFVYTPAGEVMDLPAGSTPLDFAFRIHTELGLNCVGAYVNGKSVPLSKKLANGDTVRIRKSRVARGPSLDWLNEDLGYLTTAGARSKIRAWFRRQEKSANIKRGRKQLRNAIDKLYLATSEAELAKRMRYGSVDELAEAIGTGQVSPSSVAEAAALRDQLLIHSPLHGQSPDGQEAHSGVVAMAPEDIPTRIAMCCKPAYGDDAIGYLTQRRGLSVHRRNCSNLRGEHEPERQVAVAWGHASSRIPDRLRMDAVDRVGLLRDITAVVSSEQINIHSITSDEDPHTQHCTVSLTVYTTGLEQLSRLFAKLEAIPGVRTVSRMAVNRPDVTT